MRHLAWLLLPLLLSAQTSFFGYFESEGDVVSFSDQRFSYGYAKLRLDLEARPADAVLIGANFNLQRYVGQTTWDLIDFLPASAWMPIFCPDTTLMSCIQPELPMTIPDTSYLDNLYLRLSFQYFDLTVGKQQISLGTGYAWNPTDIFNIKQLLDPSYEQTGVEAFRAEVPLGSRLGMDLIYQPGMNWDHSARMAQAKMGIGRFDLTASLAHFDWDRILFLDPAARLVKPRTLLGGSFVGEAAGLGVWGEFARNQLEDAPDFDEYVLGADYTFVNGVYLLLEHLHNGAGVAQKSNLQLTDYLRAFGGETHSLMQDYLFLYGMAPLTDVLTLTALGFANLDDKSFAFNPGFEWSVYQSTDASLLVSLPVGDQSSEFGIQDWGLRLRIRSFF